MTTLPPEQPETSSAGPHAMRGVAESFGVDAQSYDRARPSYPDALVLRITALSPGLSVLDVGCGTGIAARQFEAAGCTVLGIEPDARMADFARARGLQVEVATFEDWDARERKFDAVVAAQSWHWVDPQKGVVKAARVLRMGGQLAIFGHVFEPPTPIAEAFATAFRRVAPDSPFASAQGRRPLDLYRSLYAKIADAIRQTEQFDDAEQWQFDWTQPYTRDEWLALLPTTGGLTQLGRVKREEILREVGTVIDSMGGAFTMEYTTLAICAAAR